MSWSSVAKPTSATSRARRNLWVAGTRPFGPTCVLVRATGSRSPAQHVGRGRPRRHSAREFVWHLVESDEHHLGAAAHRRCGHRAARWNRCAVTGFRACCSQRRSPMPSWSTASSRCAPPGASRPPRKCLALRDSIAVAEAGLAAAVSELRPGVSEQALAGVLLEALAAGGVCTPSNQDVAWVTSREHPWRRVNADGRVQARRPGGLFRRGAGRWVHG